MKISKKEMKQGQLEVSVELTIEEYQPFLKNAAFFISEQVHIDGFRPGKAPFEIIKKQVGEQKIWEEALEFAVKKTLPKVLEQENIASIGSPHIDIEKLAPGNEVIYKAILNVLPVVSLPDLSTLSVLKKEILVNEETFQKELSHLLSMRAKEILVDRPCKTGDKIIIDFWQYIDRIQIDNGMQKNFPMILGKNTFIPDFEKNLIGLKGGDKKEFAVVFPKNYHMKNLSGKLVEFKVDVKQVFEIELPSLNDDFAKSLGNFQSLDELKAQLRNNLKYEAIQKEEERVDNEIIELLTKHSQIGNIPELLITSETKKMLQELEHNVISQGVDFEEYLQHMKKNRSDLLLDFVNPALKRIKFSLITRKIASEQNFDASHDETNKEIEELKKTYQGNSDAQKNIDTFGFKNYIRNVIASRKVMAWLKERIIKKSDV